jgi:hypothetical protein
METAPSSLAELVTHVMDREEYPSLSEMARHTTIKYKTLWTWKQDMRKQIRPPTEQTLRTFAADFRLPEAVVFRAAGRSWSDPAELDGESLELVHAFKAIPAKARPGALAILRAYSGMDSRQRVIAERTIKAIRS